MSITTRVTRIEKAIDGDGDCSTCHGSGGANIAISGASAPESGPVSHPCPECGRLGKRMNVTFQDTPNATTPVQAGNQP
jgi:hypothetical protein